MWSQVLTVFHSLSDFYEMDFSWIFSLLIVLLPTLFFLLIIAAFLGMFGDLKGMLKFRYVRLRLLSLNWYRVKLMIAAVFLLFVISATPFVAANTHSFNGYGALTVKASPGSAAILLGMPCTQKVEGLVVAASYDVDYDDTEIVTAVTADSEGEITFTFTVTVEGVAELDVRHAVNTTSVYKCNIEGINIMIYIQPLVQYAIMIMLIGAVISLFSGIIYSLGKKNN